MESEKGIALIATLLILAAVMAIGIGSFSLSQMNMKIAENAQSKALAQARAESNINVAMILLEQQFNSSPDKKFPTSLTIPTINNASAFGANDYTYTPSLDRKGYTLVVKGKTISGGLHQSEALVGSASGATVKFPIGFVSEGVVRINGNFETVNAGIHGNLGFDLNGNATYTSCAATCESLSGNARPVTAQAQPDPPELPVGYTCKTGGNGSGGLCSGITPVNKIPKVTVGVPPYGLLRNDKANDANNNGIKDSDEKAVVFGLTSAVTRESSNTPFPISGCTHEVRSTSLATSYPPGSKVCVVGPSGTDPLNISIPKSANYSNITMIVKGDVTVNGSSTLTNFNLVSMGTLYLGGNAKLTNSRLLADKAVDINGNFSYTGSTTVASGGTLNINGNIDSTDTGTNIGLALISVGDMSLNGNAQTGSKPLKAALWSGRKMSLNGNTRLIGGASSVGSTDAVDLDINGNSYVDGRGTFTNSDLPTATSTPTVLSRR